MRVKRLFFIAILCAILQSIAYAQNSAYQFSHLDINNGLSNNQTNCIFKDSYGFMWFGTISGLNRYDGYRFRVFKNERANANSIADNFVSRIYEGPGKKMWVFTHNNYSIYDPQTEKFSNNINKELARLNILSNDIGFIKKDSRANYWFSTNNSGIYCRHPNNTTTFYSHSKRSDVVLHSNWVMDIADCGNGLIWFIYSDGALELLDIEANKIISRTALPTAATDNKLSVNYSLRLDNEKKLWIWANARSMGVYFYDTQAKVFKHYSKENPDGLLNSNIINSIIVGDDNKMWIGTDHGGINIIDNKTAKITYVLPREDDPKSLMGNNVVLYKDQDGIIWAGTYKQGISYYHKGIFQFPLVRRYLLDKTSLPYEDVDCFKEDKAGGLWIGTNGGGLIYYNPLTHQYTSYRHNAADPNSLASDVVISLCIDHEGKLWVGTYFGGLDYFDGQTFKHYRQNNKVAGSISDDRIYSLFEDKNYNIWAGTFAGGISIYNRKTHLFSSPYSTRLRSTYIGVLYPDDKGNIWVGEDQGIDVINTQTNQTKHYAHDARNANSLIDRDINSIVKDSRQLMWIGTKGGLSVLNLKNQKFINLGEEQHLPANNVINILEDKQGRMWFSSNNGVSCITLTGTDGNYKFDIRNFNETDGLQGREFNVNAAFKTNEGKMIFGGGHGFNIFDPAQINVSTHKPPLIFTDLQLFNKSVAVGDTIKGSVVLNQAISDTKSIVFNHSQNVFSLEFAAFDFFNPNKVQYEYKLEGFDKSWLVVPASIRKATYTNLDAGDYIFKVKAYNSNNIKNASIIELRITVQPPFWKSTWAYLLYAICFVIGLFYIRHRGILKLKKEFATKQQQIEVERKAAHEVLEAKRMHELDLMKIKFFTNVSHEFRTPLSLILSPIEQLIKANDKPEQQQQLQMIKRNGRRLLNLVNQLLDFRKMEFKELKLSLTHGDIVAFIKEVSVSFSDIAIQKNLRYVFDSEVESLVTEFDQDKLERILFNLLSNAFKFTPSGGHICILLALDKTKASANGGQMLEIKVIDTGIGITPDKQDKIFERFFQDDMPQNLLNQGSGIGLSITREFVKMHGGEISVESELNQGSCFTILLPVTAENGVAATVGVIKVEAEAKKGKDDILRSNKKPVILLIEDNDDLRFYLKDNLKHQFIIIEACNGREGWQKALAMHPNLIVSDISMPEMNGIELCRKIKADNRTTHIPVILLTASSEPEDQLLGLDSGANDYIMKPFNFEILLSKVKNLLLLQETLKKTYQKQQDVKVQQIEVASEDDKFIKNAINHVEINITNPNFSVEELSRLMLLSRVSLYKKLLMLTGKTPVDFIRNIRLEKAVQLLEKSKLNIANVAYEVGFGNPTYFAKVFREEYGMLPSEYINQLKKKEKEYSDHV